MKMNKPKLNGLDVETTTIIGAWATSTSASTSASTKTIIPLSPKNSTIEQYIKEWKERGWELSRTTSMIYIAHLKKKKSIGIGSNNLVKINGWLEIQELELLIKTIRALVVKENE